MPRKTSDDLKEKWDLYDRNMNICGKQTRSDKVAKNLYHLTVSAFIYDQNDRILLQKRSMLKLNHPGKWEASAGGSVIAGENSCQAIRREIKEELDLNLNVSENDFYLRIFKKDWIEDWYAVQTDLNFKDIHPLSSEVQKVDLFNFKDAQTKLKETGITNYNKELLESFKKIKMNDRF